MRVSSEFQSKRSRLFAGISGGRANFLLVDSDFESGIFFKERLCVKLPHGFKLADLDGFLEGVLPVWGEELDREIINCPVGACVPTVSAGGVDGTTLVVSPKQYVDGYRSNILQVAPICFDGQTQINAVAKATRALEASEVVFVLINWDEIVVFHAVVAQGGNVHVNELRIEPKIPRDLDVARIKNLVAIKPELSGFRDFVENLVAYRPIESRSSQVWDFQRAYVMSNLIEVKDSQLREFGMKGDNPYLIITGDACGILPKEHLLLAVIDGLQLRGRYRVSIDQEYLSMLGLVVNPELMTFPTPHIYPGGYIYVSPERGATGKKGKTAFTGNLIDVDSRPLPESSMLLGQSGQIYSYNLSGIGRFQIKPARDVYFPNLARQGEYLTDDFGKWDSRLIVDCREIPVVYGPGHEANASRLSGWLHGLRLD